MDTTLQAQTTVQLHTVPHIQSLSKYFESHLFSLKKLGPSKSKITCDAFIATKFKPKILEIKKLFSKLGVLKVFVKWKSRFEI